MKLSAQEEYGLRCLLRLGAQGDSGSLTISGSLHSRSFNVVLVRT